MAVFYRGIARDSLNRAAILTSTESSTQPCLDRATEAGGQSGIPRTTLGAETQPQSKALREFGDP